MKESYKEQLAIDFGHKPYSGSGDAPGVASSYAKATAGPAGPAFLVECKLEIAGSGGVSLETFNPVRPVSGSGATLDMTATPNVLVTAKGNGSLGALLIFGGGVELGYRDVLEEISATLSCQ